MGTHRPFAYYTGNTLTGITQVGNIVVGNSEQDYSTYGGLTWWNGPDEDLGYVFAMTSPGTQPTPISGVFSNIGFYRTDLTDSSFIQYSELLANQSFATANDAKTWLDSNGYWTSWVNSGPTLLADLDASNASSYPGTGSTWFDLTSNNNDGTLSAGSGTLTFGSAFGGEFDLNGGSGTRISFVNNSDTQLSTSTTKAYSIWFKADAVGFMSFSRTLMNKLQGLGGSSTGDGFFMGINSTDQLIAKVVSNNGSVTRSIAGIGATINTGTWYMATLVVKVSPDPDTFKLYINTTEVGSTTGGGSSLSSDNRSLLLGNYDSGVQNAMAFDGMIGNFYIYEGDFTSTEVQMLFDLTKTRFGYV